MKRAHDLSLTQVNKDLVGRIEDVNVKINIMK